MGAPAQHCEGGRVVRDQCQRLRVRAGAHAGRTVNSDYACHPCGKVTDAYSRPLVSDRALPLHDDVVRELTHRLVSEHARRPTLPHRWKYLGNALSKRGHGREGIAPLLTHGSGCCAYVLTPNGIVAYVWFHEYPL